jgi:hypothetical protein
MLFKGPIELIKEFESERDEIIFQMRENFLFVYRNGGSEKYTLEKLARLIKDAVPEIRTEKRELKNFLEDKAHFPRLDMSKILKLLELSIRLRDEVEPHVQAAQKLIAESKSRWANLNTPKSPDGMA